MIKKIVLSVVLLTVCLEAATFKNAVLMLEKHESIETALFKYKAGAQEAKLKGSWGDPQLKVSAKNFPNDSLAFDQTPMTGIEFGISQKIPLTSKYGNIKNAFSALSQAYLYDAKDKKEKLTKAFWEILILKRKIKEELSILTDNSRWIEKILKVSKRLYATGKVTQQALLDIQIRRSEIERDISNKSYELSQIDDKLIYLIGDFHIEEKSIPWESLETTSTQTVDYRELGLQEKLKAKQHRLKASRLNYVPDVTVSLGYTQRSNIDGNGDFVGASLSFPIPLSDEKYSKVEIAVQEKSQVTKYYENYKRVKRRDLSILSKQIKKLMSEINILNSKMIKYAMNSRQITSKSYETGNSSYVELLQSELKLQKILLHKVTLVARRDIKRVTFKYIKGEPLNE
ncbi:MAG: TolC family protein [Thiovulaceae bacterium]|nr:TolC family protein [Sulfurimonadaceae bacterium]